MEKKVFTDYVLRFHPIIMNLSTCSPLIRLDLVKALMPPKDFTKSGIYCVFHAIYYSFVGDFHCGDSNNVKHNRR